MVPPMKRTPRLLAAVLVLLGALLAACGGDDSSSSSTTTAATTTTTPPATGNLTIFAAASLTAAFNDIGAAFMKANPQAKTTFSYDASSALVGQIIQGAPAD